MSESGVSGKVYLVGAGPGDPGLFTIKGARLLEQADVVVNDRLASPRLLSYARPDAEIIYVGKASRDHTVPQDEIIRLIIDRALTGKMVVRLKGGDPFVFGRGGEEAAALAEAGVEFEVVPGISSSVAVPAYAGIPVTHRGAAASFGVVTGHEAPGKPGSDIRWDRLATALDTIVFLMGVENLPEITRELIANGRSDQTPVAVIQWGTHSRQKSVVGTLADVVQKCQEAGIKAPAVTVVGEVVRLRETISWFEKKPFFGRRVIVTRSEAQASALSSQFEELGAEVDEFPVIRFDAPADRKPLDAAIAGLEDFDWIIFTSANGVEWFVDRLIDLNTDVRAMGGAKLAAIGPRTAEALQDLKLKVDYVPSEYIAEAVVDQFPEDLAGKRILIPRAAEARQELPDGLSARGAHVTVVSTYQTVIDRSREAQLRERVAEGVDIVTFTSASTVRNFFTLIEGLTLPESVLAACIGPITAEAARSRGMEPAVIAEQYTMKGLVQALVSHLAKGSKQA